MPRKRKNERADGRIQIPLDIGRDTDGKRLRKYFYGATRAEAEAKKAAYLAQVNGTPYTANLTVSEWVDEYMSAYRTGVNPAYLPQDDVPYNRLKAALGDRLISSIREIDLQAELNSLAGRSFSSLDKYMQVMKRVFKKARKNKLITDDPAEDLTLPAYTKGSHRALTPEEIDLILKYWNLKENYAGLWVLLMLFCGLRRGEMMALDWSAVDLDAHSLTVRQTAVIVGNKALIEQRAKTDAGIRILPIPDFLYSALLAVPVKRGFVCLSAHGKPLTEAAVSRGLERFNSIINRMITGDVLTNRGKRTDLKPEAQTFKIRYHDLRHTYATFLYDAGVDVKTAAYLLGHADITVTMKIYTHLSEERKAVSSEALTAYLDGLKTT
ncbi:MAG: site-specific integrase [Clostridiales bacterium]|nr:site-specific integrase [Clostridiales bacterium]